MLFVLLFLLRSASCIEAQAIICDSEDDKPRTPTRQREEYRQHNYDSYRNGPLQETLAQQRREERR